MIIIKIVLFLLFVSIVNSILQHKPKKPYCKPTEPDVAPEPQTDKKYLCVSWNLRTGEVIEHECE
jgi:hypothetical protein